MTSLKFSTDFFLNLIRIGFPIRIKYSLNVIIRIGGSKLALVQPVLAKDAMLARVTLECAHKMGDMESQKARR